MVVKVLENREGPGNEDALRLGPPYRPLIRPSEKKMGNEAMETKKREGGGEEGMEKSKEMYLSSSTTSIRQHSRQGWKEPAGGEEGGEEG